jgi:tetratricopeptide (TPR) repeat protein
MTRRTYGERHPRVAEDLMNLGATEQERGNYVESERYFRDALERTIAFHGENHFRTAGNLVYLGRSLLQQGRLREAQDAFERSLAIRERVFGMSHPTVANTLNELGALAVKENRYDDAEAAFLRVRAIYQAAYPGMSYKTGVATGNLADTYLYRKDYRRAEPMYRDALTHYIATQGPEHLNTGIGYIKLGRCLLRSGRFAAAVPETQRGYAIVAKVASPNVSFLQAARLDLSIAFDSLGDPAKAAMYRAEREKYLPKPVAASTPAK